MKSVKRGVVSVVGMVALGIMVSGWEPLVSLENFLVYLANPVALAAVSSLALQVMKRLWPDIEEGKAFFASILCAVAMSVLAMFLLPYTPSLPVEAERLWPFVVWFMQQAWYWLMKDSALYKRL